MNASDTTSKRSELSVFASGYCGDYYGIADQGEGETDSNFQRRVADTLRSRGHIIEAHEVMKGARYDDDSTGASVIEGLIGATSIALSGANYGANGLRFGSESESGHRILDDEAVAGSYLRHKQANPDPEVEAAAFLLQLGLDPFGSR